MIFGFLSNVYNGALSYFNLIEEGGQDSLTPEQNERLGRALRRLEKDNSNNQLLSKRQLKAFRVALQDFQATSASEATADTQAVLDVLRIGTEECFDDKSQAIESYLAATNAIKEIYYPTSTSLYLTHIILRLAYSIAGFCTMYSAIQSIIDQKEDQAYQEEHHDSLFTLKIIPGILSGMSNLIFTSQLIDLLKLCATRINSDNSNDRTPFLYFIPGFIATIPAVVPLLHTENSFPQTLRFPVAAVAFNALWPIYSKDIENFTKICKDGLKDGAIEAARKVHNFARDNKKKTAAKLTVGFLGTVQSFCYTKVMTSYFDPNSQNTNADLGITIGFMLARVPFVTIITDNAITAFENRNQANYCSAENAITGIFVLANCVNSALVIYTKSNFDQRLRYVAIPATLVFHFFNRLKNIINTKHIPQSALGELAPSTTVHSPQQGNRILSTAI